MHPGTNQAPSEVYGFDADGTIYCGEAGAGDGVNSHGSIQDSTEE